jgi:enamine deaminase RidA (YjgF/YER057c/UK114 family)
MADRMSVRIGQQPVLSKTCPGRATWLHPRLQITAAFIATRCYVQKLLQDVFGKDKNPCRLVYGVASLPLGTPVELEVIFEVAA